MKTAWQEDAVCKNRNDGDGSMHRTENVELTVVCLLEDGGKVLLQNRKKEDWHGWALPGGHVAPGESFVDAVIREMREETGLTIRNPKVGRRQAVPNRSRPVRCAAVQGCGMGRNADVIGGRGDEVGRIQPASVPENRGRSRRDAAHDERAGTDGIPIPALRRGMGCIH